MSLTPEQIKNIQVALDRTLCDMSMDRKIAVPVDLGNGQTGWAALTVLTGSDMEIKMTLMSVITQAANGVLPKAGDQLYHRAKTFELNTLEEGVRSLGTKLKKVLESGGKVDRNEVLSFVSSVIQ